MILLTVLGILVGGAFGVWMGMKRSCKTGACPLTSNPYIGGLYGAVVGALLVSTIVSASSTNRDDNATTPTVTATKPAEEKSPNIQDAVKEPLEDKSVPGKKPVTIGSSKELKEIFKSDKTVVVDFWASWCGPCKAIDPVLKDLAAEYPDTLIVAKVNVDDQPGIARSFSVRSIPTLLVVKNGKIDKRIVGFRDKAALIKEAGLSAKQKPSNK